MQQPIRTLLKRLWGHTSFRRRGQFAFLLALMVVVSFAEIFSIGAVLPFLGALTSPERIFSLPLAKSIIQALGVTNASQLLFPLTVTFVSATLIAGSMRLLLLWANTRFSFAMGADLSIGIYRRTLYQPYAVHCSRNSSEVINAISSKSNGVIYGVILPVLTLMSSSIILIAILLVLLTLEPVVALATFGGFGSIYAIIIFFTRKQLRLDSECVARETSQVVKSLQEGLGGIRDVLIDGSQATYCQIYRDADIPMRRAQGNSLFISLSPRYAMEALGMLLIASLAYSLAQQSDGITKVIPILGALALGAQRLLPLLQQAYAAWAQLNSSQVSLQDILELLDQPLPPYSSQLKIKPLSFEHNITLNQVGFRYGKDAPYVLKRIDLEVKKGERIGFIGVSGSGKSTLLDIVMGLLSPTDGTLEVDGKVITEGNHRAWQAHIAHVPQVIFLADSTIEENIAFGVPKDKIDTALVRHAAKQAQLDESVQGWPDRYQTFVGERGIRLSGGQRQRIGIARALYKQANVIIFDEATSALDNDTEGAVMESIEGLGSDLTVLIIAHRLSTLRSCSRIVELSAGSIKRVCSYQDIVKSA